ncbi:phosphoribosyltransferase [Maritimibacter sp. 55A14]|uniref:phosphoribosyltransferase n=1 Tax=Maritimibacter sp. 55A14 TaxID=2174844 RepID=UPI000D603643|nr:phosphoribosyltransferase family protein [Maritimibacter sp. 55A14]PWE34269.1 phosphoribosyltransferase [Maritimibacter sp. 55A14]
MTRFADRIEAGRALGDALRNKGYADPVVVALPRGGVPVGYEVALALSAPLDIVMVRKIGVPGHEELAAGAVVNGDAPQIVINDAVAAMARLDRAGIERLAGAQLAEIARRRALYQGGRAPVPVEGRTVIVVDDGIATGATMRASLKALARRGPARLVLAVPVAPRDTLGVLEREVDEVVCLSAPADFLAVGQFYVNFGQVPDAEVTRLLDAASGQSGQPQDD